MEKYEGKNDRRKYGGECNLGGINSRRIKEERTTAKKDLEEMTFRRTDDVEEVIAKLRNSLAGASSVAANRFQGLTPERAAKVLRFSILGIPSREEVAHERSSIPELQFASSVTEFSRLVQFASMLGELNDPDEVPVRAPDIIHIMQNMRLTPEEIAVMNGMQEPVHLSVPCVSMRYLYTRFLPAILKKCGMDELILRDGVLEYLDVQDQELNLTGVDKTNYWRSFFVDGQVYSGGDNGTIEDLANNFPQSEIGKVARVIDPMQYAMLLATEIIRTFLAGEYEVFLDRHAHTLLGPVKGDLPIIGQGQALVGSWGDALGGLEAPTLRIVSSKSDAEGVIFRPTVCTA